MAHSEDVRKKHTENVDVDELYELRKLKLLEEVKQALIIWASRRTYVVTIVLAIVGTVGLNVLVAASVRSLLSDDVKEAQRASVIATESSRQARDAMDEATRTAKAYVNNLEELRGQAQKLATSIDRLQADLDGKGRSIRIETRLSTEELQTQMEALRKAVEKLLERSTITETETNRLKEDFRSLQQNAADRLDKFQKNSAYKVQMLTDPGRSNPLLQTIRKSLETIGFETQEYAGSISYHERGYGLETGTLEGEQSIVVFYQDQSEGKAREIATLIESVQGVHSTKLIKDKALQGTTGMGVFLPPRDSLRR